ncbi:hypothetical protein Q4S45_17880 [Massilia sp. R2A-15]|uniref:hypothetical protein n=1 Tax=Massilia sp. R2A-15 TaxID=3064278 RepID=UPI00273712C1|nr:hypothetical protein [Massilia sp. R2A-15]WLI88573.1 hypothetical protein Q4S45_17880 [Massilia sp. R2A-15]
MTMFGLFAKRPPITTIRLNSLERTGGRSHAIRPALLEGLLQAWRAAIGDLPSSFDIHGPYGIAKGQSIGLRAFESKLQRKGHDAYSGYSCWDEHKAGFNVSFFESPPYPTSFVEILFWFVSTEVQADAKAIVSAMADVIPIDYGYVSELPGNLEPLSESPIKNGIFGSSVQIGTNELSQWNRKIHLAAEGRIRDIYPINFLNPKQIDSLRSFGEFEVEAIAERLYMLRIDDVAHLARLKSRIQATSGFAG